MAINLNPLSKWTQVLEQDAVDPEEKLKKELLMFATGLTCLVAELWLICYWLLGLQLSATVPLVYQVLCATLLIFYFKTKNFRFFRLGQLSLFLFFPFYVQWSIGDFVSASGVILWGLLAPVGALLFYGIKESIPWFTAYLILTAVAGVIDFYIADLNTKQIVKPSISAAFFALNFMAISTMVYLLLRYAMKEKEKIKVKLMEAHTLLIAEQERSERLLLNILPGPIAERLKKETTTIADGFADVTVMFADIVNFTQVAEGLSPKQIFSMLNNIFSSFDNLAEKYNLEKIKTIGDAYMVAGGLNDENSNYSEAIMDMALEMCHVMEQDLQMNPSRLQIRIGIGTGPVVAGVVGKKKFIYDLWGDTVNIASRITAEGLPNRIHVDPTTFRRLRNRYNFDEPQSIYLKGKGEIPVYRLVGKK